MLLEATKKTYNVINVKFKNREKPSFHIEVENLKTNQISAVCFLTPY